jgi:predicted membrane protein
MIRRMMAAALITGTAAMTAAAQTRDFSWSKALAAGSVVSISNINGNIKIVPSTTGRVDVSGTKRGSSGALDRIKAEVQETSRGIQICVIDTDADAYCDERGYHSEGRSRRNNRWDDDRGNARMDLEIAVPTNLLVRPSTVSGDIDVTGAHGDISANSVSGDIILDRLSTGSVNVNTVSGDVTVRVETLTGRGDFQFNSVSGDIELELPRDFAADLSMSTVSGDINSDFAITLGGSGRMRSRSFSGRIGGGGRRLEVSTVSGDLKLRMK